MKFLSDIISSMSSAGALPVVICVVLAVAFIAMLLVTIFTLVSIKKSGITAKKIIDLPLSAIKKESKKDDDKDSSTPPPIGEWLNGLLIKRGYINVNNIVRSFFKAAEFLKEALGVGYKYKLPWFMMIGGENSGKSSLLSGFTHEEIFDDEKEDADCVWWFLKNGVILDIKGSVLLPKIGFNANEKSWNIILNMLSRYRSAKPLNGIILAISAEELYGKNKLPMDEIKKRAMFLSRKLSFAQNYLGMKLPIYVVVTKTDIVPGFQSFCSEIPVRNRTNMLGWSSPYSLGTIYTSRILEEGFEAFEDELNEIRMEIFSESSITTTRDGVFVFPSELLSVKEALSCYIDTIFKSSSTDERFYFRGFYFTGDSKMVPLLQFDSSQEEGMAILGTPDADVNEAGNLTASFRNEDFAPKKIFFFDDLLLKKVFMEDGIASPMRSKVYQANKSIFIAKISTAAFVMIGSYGLFSAKDHLKHNKDSLFPALFKISSIIKNASDLTLKNLENSGNEILSECTTNLLSLMQQLSNSRFSSLFVPASWFSSINKDLTETLRISYQRVVIRTIYMNLILKSRKFLNMKATHKSSTISEVLNPYKSSEYLLLKDYVNGLITLQKNIKKFDSLRTSGDPKDLNDLIDYTFQGSIPKEFLDNYQQFRSILMNTPFPPIDLSPYKKVAYDVLINLFQNFLDTIFTSRSDNSIVSMLGKFISSLTRQNIRDVPDCSKIVSFSKGLSAVCKELGDAGKTWLDNESFESDTEYNGLLNGIEELFGKETSQKILNITKVNFEYLKSKLTEFNNSTNISSKPLPFSSSGIYLIEKCLADLCTKPFMEPPGDYQLLTDIPEGKMIFWDDELVQYAYEVGKSFEQFAATSIKDFPRSMQEGIMLMTKANMCSLIASIIAKSQSVVDSPVALTSELTSEEILQKQTAELKGVAPRFIALLKILRNDKFSFVFGDLRAILNKIAFSLLNHTDNLLENQKPYCPNNLTFNYWNGEIGAGLLAYCSSDIEELILYLQLQRKLIERLALDFVEPIVNFLNSDIIYDKNFGNHGQLIKWTRIVENVKNLGKKDPANSVSMLERYIMRSLNEYSLDNITSKILLKDLVGESGDYFSNIVKIIKKSIMARAEILLRKRNIERYNALLEYYTKHLENTYPFSSYEKSQRTAKDADLDSVKEFFKMYDEFGGSPEAILDQIHQLGGEAKKCYDFLKKIHDIRLFFANFFDNQNEAIKVCVEINFDANKREESNTEYLIDRVFKPNGNVNIQPIMADKKAFWYFGEPIEISFRLAKDDQAPKITYDPNDSDLTIDGNSARFQCIGNWSLLRFLQKYRANSNGAMQNQIMLCFKVTLNTNKVMNIYASIQTSLPKKPGEATVNLVKVPDTPEKMPPMPREVIAVANESVLTPQNIKPDFSNSSEQISNDIVEENDDVEIETRPAIPSTPARAARRSRPQSSPTRQPSSTARHTVSARATSSAPVSQTPAPNPVSKILESAETPSIEPDSEFSVSDEPIE